MLFAARINLREVFQEMKSLAEMKAHNERDACIRNYIKHLGDHFREVGNSYQQKPIPCSGWNLFSDRACITHQDDMKKVGLPHFIATASWGIKGGDLASMLMSVS